MCVRFEIFLYTTTVLSSVVCTYISSIYMNVFVYIYFFLNVYIKNRPCYLSSSSHCILFFSALWWKRQVIYWESRCVLNLKFISLWRMTKHCSREKNARHPNKSFFVRCMVERVIVVMRASQITKFSTIYLKWSREHTRSITV